MNTYLRSILLLILAFSFLVPMVITKADPAVATSQEVAHVGWGTRFYNAGARFLQGARQAVHNAGSWLNRQRLALLQAGARARAYVVAGVRRVRGMEQENRRGQFVFVDQGQQQIDDVPPLGSEEKDFVEIQEFATGVVLSIRGIVGKVEKTPTLLALDVTTVEEDTGNNVPHYIEVTFLGNDKKRILAADRTIAGCSQDQEPVFRFTSHGPVSLEHATVEQTSDGFKVLLPYAE